MSIDRDSRPPGDNQVDETEVAETEVDETGASNTGADQTEADETDVATEPVPPRSVPYVPGFDGLRGIGVMLMLLYHAEVAWVGNGALFTIEMFFVLSGFLITYLFLVERHNHGHVDLKRFWARRGRRLLPALFGIVALVGVWAMFQPPTGPSPVQVNQAHGDGIAAMLYTSNWWQLFSGQSYFERFSAPSPFQHTWSLSIEEQFYLLIAIIAFFGFRKWGVRGRGWLIFAFGGAVLAAVWMGVLARIGDLSAQGLHPFGVNPDTLPDWAQTFFNMRGDGDASRMYLGTDTRIAASLMGVGAAFVVDRINLGKLRKSTAELMLFVGVGGLLVMFFGITSRTTPWMFYGVYLLCDIFTLLAIIALMAPHGTLTGKFLSWKPLVFIGLLSYSLYVWHFPIFVILDESRVPFRDGALAAFRIGVAFVVAFLSYRFFEQPIRLRGLHTRQRRVVAAVATAVVVLMFLVAARPYSATDMQAASGSEYPIVLVAGDSMAYTLFLGVRTEGADLPTGVEVGTAGIIGCGIGEGDMIKNGHAIRQNSGCKQMVAKLESATAKAATQPGSPVAVAMLSWGWDLYDRRIVGPDGGVEELRVGSADWATWYRGEVERGVEALAARGTKVTLLTMPCIDLEADVPNHPDELAAEPHRVQAVNDVLATVAKRNPQRVSLVDLGKFLCPDGRHFRTQIDGVAMTTDGLHFTPAGAVVVWNWLQPQLVPR